MKSFLIVILSAFTFSACSLYKIDSRDITEEYYPPKKSVGEVVYLEKIDRPHEVIGIVTVNAERRQHLKDVVEKIKYEAAILGGDAITDIQTDATGAWKKLPAQKLLGNAYIRANFSASVAAWK